MKYLGIAVTALLCLAIGIKVYAAVIATNHITCVVNEFNFGCFTPLGWAVSLAAAVMVAAAIYAWERFRD